MVETPGGNGAEAVRDKIAEALMFVIETMSDQLARADRDERWGEIVRLGEAAVGLAKVALGPH